MKRSILFVLSLALLLPLAFTIGEAPATALTCEEQCRQTAFQCQQSCQGQGVGCREWCNQEYYACLAGCP